MANKWSLTAVGAVVAVITVAIAIVVIALGSSAGHGTPRAAETTAPSDAGAANPLPTQDPATPSTTPSPTSAPHGTSVDSTGGLVTGGPGRTSSKPPVPVISRTPSTPPITHAPASIYVHCSPLTGQNRYQCGAYINNSLGSIRWYLSGVLQSTGSDQTVLSGACYGSSAAGDITAVYTDPYGQQATGNNYAYC